MEQETKIGNKNQIKGNTFREDRSSENRKTEREREWFEKTALYKQKRNKPSLILCGCAHSKHLDRPIKLSRLDARRYVNEILIIKRNYSE